MSLFLLVWGTSIWGQESYLIKGRVLNLAAEPVKDVSVFIKGLTQNGTLTDENGFFIIESSNEKPTLVFTHASYKRHEEKTEASKNGHSTAINIFLEEKNVRLDETVVTESVAMTTQSINKLKEAHREIAGGTSIAVMQPDVQRLETLKDALKYESGVVIQDFFGANDQPRLSIRGSGIQSNPQRRGIYLLQDGIPVNLADGSFVIGLMDPATSESIEVYKGANALHFGAASLGGAINFNTHTGRRTQGIHLKIGGGSFGYASGSALLGNNWGRNDAFLSVSGSRQKGFRAHNQNKRINISGNYGHRFSKNIDNRTFVNYSYSDFDIPGPLTLEMLQEDPTQINAGISLPYFMGPNIARDLPGRTTAIARIANRTSFVLTPKFDVEFSAYYQFIRDRFAFPIVLSTQRTTGHDYGITLKSVYRFNKNRLTSGILMSQGFMDRNWHINKNGKDSYMFSKDKLNALNLTAFSEFYTRINEHFEIIGNIQAVWNSRNSTDRFPNPELRPWYSHSSHQYRYFHSENLSEKQHFWSVNPRIGAIYSTGKNKNYQFFGNLSTSYEPPTFDELIGSAVSNNINTSPKELFATKLDKQTAFTAEIGSRHEGEKVQWNISLYRSRLKNELLEVKDFVLGVKQTQNYPLTVHQGTEISFVWVPAKNIFSQSGKDFISLKTMYNFSDFTFKMGEYKGKRLAGIPRHYLTASLEYTYPNKFFIAVNAESQLTKNPIDHTNTVFQPAFHVYGCRAGIDDWKGLSFYIEVKNIFNTHYASSYIVSDQIILPPIPYPDFSVDNVAFFMPGQLRAFYFGLSY